MINLTRWRLVPGVTRAVGAVQVLHVESCGEAGEAGEAGPQLTLLGHQPQQGLDSLLLGSLLLQGLHVEEREEGRGQPAQHQQAGEEPADWARHGPGGGPRHGGDVEGGGGPEQLGDVPPAVAAGLLRLKHTTEDLLDRLTLVNLLTLKKIYILPNKFNE